ncbi:MAG: SDR family oxidoreductase [Halanaerobiales bacterium]|nr:SDR family oxidoreductase [Halanaerobiales bacterium]
MAEKILITGATGNIGKETIKNLLSNENDEIEVIAAVRDIDKAKNIFDFNRLRFTKFDFKNSRLIKEALQNKDKILLIRPPAISKVKKYILPLIKEAKRKDIKHIVFLSLQGVENNPLVPHYKIEKLIKNEKIPYTFLRPSFFMQNLSTTHKKEIKEDDEIYIPAGQGQTNFIDIRDIAEVASLVLTEENHKNKAYELTGKESLSYYKVANILSEELNRKIEYKNPSIFNFFTKKKKEGLSLTKILVMIGLYTAARLGKANKTTSEIQNLLGKEPITFTEFTKDYKENWL